MNWINTNLKVFCTLITIASFLSCSKNNTQLPTGIQLSKTTLSLVENNKETLLATIVPDDATDKSVVWSSSDESVATISELGEVTAIKVGTTTITATSVVDPSVKTTCAVTIIARPRGVYVVGNDGLGIVTVWENSVATILSPKGHYIAFPIISNPICVSGNDLYVIWNENGIAKLYKNGVVTSLYSNAAIDRMSVNSIRVSGSDVYILGDKRKLIGNVNISVGVVWKNGVVTPLSEGSSSTNSISVSGSDVYVAGWSADKVSKSGATLWKNGEVILRRSAVFMSVYVLGSDVYVAGSTENSAGKSVATLWKNGEEITLGDGTISTYAYSVFAEGSDVYVVGNQVKNKISVATVWKNGIATSLTDGVRRGSAYSVYVLDGDVYVAGAEYNSAGKSVATLWKNGVATSLSDGTINAEANSVYVVNR